jgi:hypothetical protein
MRPRAMLAGSRAPGSATHARQVRERGERRNVVPGP